MATPVVAELLQIIAERHRKPVSPVLIAYIAWPPCGSR
jgi:hypothetical protein